MPRGNFKRGGRGGGGRGRGGGGGGGRGRGGGGGGGQRQFQDNRVSFDQINKTNEKFERYYNTINIVPAGEERDAFWAALKKELPNSFRFTGSKGHALSVRDNMVNRYFPLIKEIQHDGRPVELPRQMPWYPNGLAYSMATPKNVVRKYEPFKEFQRFLVSETGVGNISRQEQVSMIPPLLLDVEPHHTVLDLCAAPGSKSAQLVELIHAGEEERVERAIKRARGEAGNDGVASSGQESEDSGRSTGMLIANDVDYRRAQMLIHQVKRLNSPNLIVTNHDATMFPSIELPSTTLQSGQKQGKYLKFDRVLADVPCSGDGTCRKNPNIWKDWQPQNGLGLYLTQVRILTRALQMLKVGGRVVYSTCSLNPVENEAVVASAIERCGGSTKVKLVDCSDRLPGLLRNPGLTDWSIMNRKGEIYESWPEAQQYETAESKLAPGMFPPGPEEEIPLQHCMRVYPQQQDTGGFFIVAMEKLGDIRAKAEADSKSANKSWSFTPPEAPTTAFTELLDEVSSGQINKPVTVSGGPTDTASAAERQNGTEDVVAGAGIKRAAPVDGPDSLAAKKPKFGEDVPDRLETRPLPPSVALGVEANGVEPATNVVDNVQDVEMKDELKEGAPFEQSVRPVAVPKRRRDDNGNDEAFKYLATDHPELLSIYKFYELLPDFPRDRFLVRNPSGDPVKGIYYTSQLVKEILISNENRGMKFVHGGVKMFAKQDAQGQDICRWRIQTEGLSIIEGWVGEKRVIKLQKKSTLRKLLVEMFPKVATDRADNGEETGGWKDLGEIGEQVRDIGMGCCVLRVEASPNPGEDDFSETITLPLWRSIASLNLMLPKEDRRAMLLRIYNEDVELINHSDPKSKGYKGSQPAEENAKELQEKIAEDDENAGSAVAAAEEVADEAPTADDGAE
ncbi:related to tRNA (cytosine-5-)-methyltransferase [Ramularia collo-cygni]|uniref:Related to tRNA (Cytosine-5-)-methyltransferase n=1 Tax=Ramularia collo-cygni TaxID=112498 RepID=A0A2D3VG32_9PEZI|nr:related to tRNA (cytosine-5-)-methyltransferase [Ramularia collo-cygni]CZT20829.1 related to tRNA (cytosine-5-)-methyltransferase [Ramularia collo-cygni]